jgi:hypothetical protein
MQFHEEMREVIGKAEELMGICEKLLPTIYDLHVNRHHMNPKGATEELCFPLIIKKILHKPLQGTKILGIVQKSWQHQRCSRCLAERLKRRLNTRTDTIKTATRHPTRSTDLAGKSAIAQTRRVCQY